MPFRGTDPDANEPVRPRNAPISLFELARTFQPQRLARKMARVPFDADLRSRVVWLSFSAAIQEE